MLPVIARRGLYTLPNKSTLVAATTAASISSPAEAALTAALTRANWKDVKDEVRSVGSLMREGTTNHSIALPSTFLKQDVNDNLRKLHALVERKQHNEAFAQVCALKAMVKDELYNHHRHQQHQRQLQQQRMNFSTVPIRRTEDELLGTVMHEWIWADDVEGELDEIHTMVHKSAQNHSFNSPDVELERFVEQAIDDIKLMIENNPAQHGLVLGKVNVIKGFVKQRLHNGLSTMDRIKAFEKEMQALRWADVKNEMEQIHQLMQEHTTNHSVAKPNIELEKTVNDTLRNVDTMIQAPPSPIIHDQVFDRIRNLKGVIKAELYNV